MTETWQSKLLKKCGIYDFKWWQKNTAALNMKLFFKEIKSKKEKILKRINEEKKLHPVKILWDFIGVEITSKKIKWTYNY